MKNYSKSEKYCFFFIHIIKLFGNTVLLFKSLFFLSKLKIKTKLMLTFAKYFTLTIVTACH